MIPPPAVLDRISRYETHLHRQLMQSLHELEAIQGRRNGHPSPLARLDITGDMPENPKTAKRTPLVESETDGVEPIFDANALDERDDSPADEVASLLPPVQAVSVISEEHATMTTPATRDEIIEQNGVLVGPYRAPRNLAANERGSIHDDSVATKLGFRGGTVAGSIHMEQFPPLLVHAFGERWFETGSLSCYFRNATLHEERVRPLMQKPSATSNEQVNVWMERDDGMQVLEGTASVGTPPEPSMLRRKLAEPREAGELRILAHLTAGQQLDAVPSRLVFDALTKRRLEALTEPMPWYRAASSADAPSPWGAPIVNPGLLVHMMVQIQPSMRLRERAVGLYGAIETRHINGPVFMERDYEVSGKVLALGTTPKTEYVWYETLMRDRNGRDIASMLMMLRFMKASSELWADS
jgi:hypothetical protein